MGIGRHERIVECVHDRRLSVARYLNGRTLTEACWVGEVRGSIVQVNRGCSDAVSNSERTVIHHLERIGIDYNREQRGGFIFCCRAAEDGTQPIDVGKVTELLVGRSIVDKFCDELVKLAVIGDGERGDVLRRSAGRHSQD